MTHFVLDHEGLGDDQPRIARLRGSPFWEEPIELLSPDHATVVTLDLLRVALAVAIAVCLTPMSAAGQEPVPARRHARVGSIDTLPSDSPWTVTTERIYRERLSGAFGDRLDYHYEGLDSFDFLDSTYWRQLARWHIREADVRPEFVAMMLGASRPTVTIVASTLRKAGLITYHRGDLTIVDGEGLEAASCECYRATTDLLVAAMKLARA